MSVNIDLRLLLYNHQFKKKKRLNLILYDAITFISSSYIHNIGTEAAYENIAQIFIKLNST